MIILDGVLELLKILKILENMNVQINGGFE